MPFRARGRITRETGCRLDLPPPFRLVGLREVGDAVAHASASAAELGAGTFVFVGRFDLAEFAVVLEPEQPLAIARLAFYAGMVALGDTLAALAPPEKPIAFAWPDRVYVDSGLVGGGRLAWPGGADEDRVPDWLVFGAAIRTVFADGEAGVLAPGTALAEEGFTDAGPERVAEGFARHLMVALDRWQERGFAVIAGDFRARMTREAGTDCAIDENGDLRVGRAGHPAARRALATALEAPSWLVGETGGLLR
jgi:biotin-(acetyl-CoA carboxylase) ligase